MRRYKSNSGTRKLMRRCTVPIGGLVLSIFIHAIAGAAEQMGDWTPANSTAVRNYGNDLGLAKALFDNPKIVNVSPDGRYFYVLNWRSEQSCRCRIHMLELFDTPEVRRWLKTDKVGAPSLAPVRTVSMRSGTGIEDPGTPIRGVRWRGSTALEFIGTDESLHDQIFRLEIESGALKGLTSDPYTKVPQYWVSSDVLVFGRLVPIPPQQPAFQLIEPIRRDDRTGEISLLVSEPRTQRLEWLAAYRGEEPWLVPDQIAAEDLAEPSLAPDDRHGVLSGRKYDEAFELFLIDFVTRQFEPLISARSASGTQRDVRSYPIRPRVYWTPGSDQLILVDVVRPPVDRAMQPSRDVTAPDSQLARADTSVTPHPTELPYAVPRPREGRVAAGQLWRSGGLLARSSRDNRFAAGHLDGSEQTRDPLGRIDAASASPWFSALQEPRAAGVALKAAPRFSEESGLQSVVFRDGAPLISSPVLTSAKTPVFRLAQNSPAVSRPLAPASTTAVVPPEQQGYVTVYDIASKRWQVLEPMVSGQEKVSVTGWLKPGKEFLVTHQRDGKPSEGTVYVRRGDRWVGRSVAASIGLPVEKKAALPGGLKVEVRESANDPPMLVASEGGREGVLSKPDPALEGVWRARLEPFTWEMPDGKKITGGLSLPRNVQSGTALPLVVQVDGYYPGEFLPDGSVSTGAFARQSMVAQGMVVLTLPTRDLIFDSGPQQEGPGVVKRLDAAVEALMRQVEIDPQRIGMVGHSRTGYHTHYAITHPGKTRIAAAEIWDSVVQSYPEYLAVGVFGLTLRWHLRSNGGPSFWQNKASWLEHDVLFNADRVEAATLFVETSTSQALRSPFGPGVDALMTLGAYQINDRPVEHLFMRDAGHVMTRPFQLQPAMEVAVDWMRFWLKDQEDPSAEKAEQYARWRVIRQRNEARKLREQQQTTRQDGTSSGANAVAMSSRTDSGGSLQEAQRQVREQMQAQGVPAVGTDFNRLNLMGYQALYDANEPNRAIQYFKWNRTLFPEIAAEMNDSLAEAYLQSGERELAIQHYASALALKPLLASKAAMIIGRLKDHPESLAALKEEMRRDYLEAKKKMPPK